MLQAVALFALIALAVADDRTAETLKSDSTVDANAYNYAYETSNGIAGSASGQLKNLGPEQEAIVSTGQNSWTSPEGEKISLQWVADENGRSLHKSYQMNTKLIKY